MTVFEQVATAATTPDARLHRSTSPVARKTNKQIEDIHKSVAEGIVTLQEQSEAFGDDVSTNRARVLFLALSMQLADNGVLEHLLCLSNWATEKRALIQK